LCDSKESKQERGRKQASKRSRHGIKRQQKKAPKLTGQPNKHTCAVSEQASKHYTETKQAKRSKFARPNIAFVNFIACCFDIGGRGVLLS